MFANVHVGGILRAADPEGVWEPTIDVDADVHQVVADPGTVGHVVAATALGLAESSDAGRTWRFSTEGLHAPYARAVALDGDVLFLSASTGPRGGRAAVYRREPGQDVFGKCEGGLPDWFGQNIDSHRLAAAGGTVVFGTEEGEVFLSEDGGVSWEMAAEGLGAGDERRDRGPRADRHVDSASVAELKGFFPPRSPEGKAALVPAPPWHYSGDVMTIEYRTDPDRVAQLLPEGVEVADEDPGRRRHHLGRLAVVQRLGRGAARSRSLAVQGMLRGRPLPVRG